MGKRSIAFILLCAFAVVFTLPPTAFAAKSGTLSATGLAGAVGGSAGTTVGASGRILESFHSDLSTGRAVFSIPIAVPPGRRGIQPSLSLNYSSAGKNGPVGVGWSLELGSIERSTRFGVPKFDATDTFVLKYGGVTADLAEITPGEFRLKDEGLFAKILKSSTSWTLTTKDGTTATFGATPDSVLSTSRGIAGWYLNEVRDLQGNTMTFTYTRLTQQLYPDTLSYTGHPATGLFPQNQVKFLWESRPDDISDEMLGDLVTTTQRLITIETSTAGTLVRRVSLSYRQSQKSNRSLLEQVTTTGSDGITGLPPMTFRYSADSWPTYTVSRPVSYSGGTGVPSLGGDFNGDGKPDFGWYSSGDWSVLLNTGNTLGVSFAPPVPWLTGWGTKWDTPWTGDFNGDGITDFFLQLADPGKIAVAFSDGAGHLTLGWQSSLPPDESLVMGDFNGDGITDVGTFFKTAGRWTMALSQKGNQPPLPFSTWLDNWGVVSDFVTGDFNGDGLTDLAAISPEGVVSVAFSDGSRFIPQGTWYAGPALIGKVRTAADMNGDGLTDIVYLDPATGTMGILASRGDGFYPPQEFPSLYAGGYSVLGFQAGDYNGTGLATPVLFTDGNRAFFAVPSGIPTDLLVSVDNGVGGTTTLTYQPSSLYDNTGGDGIPDLPFVTQTVASQTIYLNGIGWFTTQFTYQGGKFDPIEREFLGFAYAKVTDPVGTTAESWFHQDPHLKGRPYKQEVRDAAGNLYTRVENAWACTDLFPPAGVHFCHLASTTSTVYDGDATFKQTKVDYTYDTYGNVISQVEEGDTSVVGDERTTTTDYTFNSSLWLMGFPSHVVVTDAVGGKLSESWLTYDGNVLPTDALTKGLVTKTESWLSTGPPNPISTATYDGYGNKLTSTDALNRTTTTTYDPQATFPVQVTNTLGHTLKTSYDPGTGNILSTTDPNNQTTQNRYDPLGRLTAVLGPLDTDAAPGVRYTYDLSTLPIRVTKEVKASDSPTYYTSYSFSDGMGRTIQVRSPAKDSTQQIVSGCVEFGSRGEVAAQFLPFFDSVSSSYSSPTARIPKVHYSYDPLGRRIAVTDPDGSVTTTNYNDWTVTFTDAKGTVTTQESDAYGRLVKVTEAATSDHPQAITSYTYDPAGRLIQVTDAKGNLTKMSYDSLGRKLTMDDPDMAHWTYAYDGVGNLTSQTDAKNQILEFAYDALNRVTQKQGRPSAGAPPTILASYLYDDTSKPNGIGRLSKVTDPSGSTEFFYDLLGRETKSVKTINSAAFIIQREFDPLNRITRLIYPDNTDVRYSYSPQGISQVTGTLDGGVTFFDLLSNADYNASGETLKLQMGNGVTTDYAYDPLSLRISSIRTTDSTAHTLQDFSYAFDSVGNLTALSDRANTASQTFVYDALNRLTAATGSYGAYQYHYDSIGNLTSKDNGVTLTYGNPDGTKPHAVTSCTMPGSSTSMAMTYDACGCLLGKSRSDGVSMNLTYDVQGRPAQSVNVTAGGSGAITLTLQPGWNCIGVPFDLADPTLRAVLSALTLGSDYDQVSKPTGGGPPWASFVGDPDADETSSLDFGKGFWIHVNRSTPVTLTLSGATPNPLKSLTLTAGWNLIASPALVAAPLAEALKGLSAGTDYSFVKRWNAASQAFETVTGAVQPGEALWVNMAVNKTWIYPTYQKTTTTFAYDGDGGRVQKTVDDGTSIKTSTYVGELYEALPGSITRAHVFFGPTRLTTLERTPSLASTQSFTDRFTLLASAKRFLEKVEETFVGKAYADLPLPSGTKLYFYHGDHLGSVNVITDSTGAQVKLNEFSPFGSTVRAEPVEARTPFGFTGKRLDSTTGLYYYGARYYDPELGRFIQPDSIVQAPSDPQTLNRYTYVHNNPLIYTDPTGHSFWRRLGRFFRQIAAPIAAVVVFIAVAAIPGVGPFLAPLAAAATYNAVSVMGANMERGRGFFESVGRGLAAGAATFGFGTIAGGAASAALTGQDPGRGALLGAVQGAAAVVGGVPGAPANDFVAVAQSAAIGAAGGAAGAAIVGGDPLKGAIYGGASAAAVTAAFIAFNNFQAAIDTARSQKGSEADGLIVHKILQLPSQETITSAGGSADLGFWDTHNAEFGLAWGNGRYGIVGGLKADSSGVYSYYGTGTGIGRSMALTVNSGSVRPGLAITTRATISASPISFRSSTGWNVSTGTYSDSAGAGIGGGDSVTTAYTETDKIF